MNHKPTIGLLGLVITVVGVTAFASIAAASLTFTGTGVPGDGAVVVDSPGTISIGTSTATGITIGNPSSVGSRISLSSEPSTFGTITQIVSDTEVRLDSNWTGDSLGNGTSQTITAYPSLLQLRIPSGSPYFMANDQGQIAIGSNDYTNTNTPVVPDKNSLIFIDTYNNGLLNTGINVNLTGPGNNGLNGVSASVTGTGSSGTFVAFGNSAGYQGTGTAGEVIGSENHAILYSGGTAAAFAAGGVSDVNNFSTGTIAEGDAWVFQSPQGTGPITNAYGVHVQDQIRGTNNWAIRTGLGKVQFGDVVQIDKTTFSGLPTCNSTTEGSQRPVTDSSTSTLGATISGSGSNHVLAYCDGTNWTVMAK